MRTSLAVHSPSGSRALQNAELAPGNGSASENLTCSYVLHERSAYKIGNFAYATELDDFLQDAKFFDKQLLKAAPAKPRIP
jgi:hypothetical protein